MGTSKFSFPIPGRRSKPAPPPPPPVTTAPRTKAEKLLGTGEVVDGHAKRSPADPRWGWDNGSKSNISIAVSDTTASRSGYVETGLGIVQEGAVTASPTARRAHWEDESAIIPPGLQGYHPGAGHDGVTDASSLRRRQSSSTITSYYDKSTLPLSISQQTSNSAMAKGLPSKASLLLDIEGTYTEPAIKPAKKKKPAMLDLTSLLNRQRSSKFLKPDKHKGLVLGPDLVTKSPSVMSLSPNATPPPIVQRTERGLRKKLTKESLKESLPSPEAPRHLPAATRPGVRSRGEDRGHSRTKSTVDLMHLYDHYEQRSFADVLEDAAEEVETSNNKAPSYPTPPTSSSSGNGYLAPQHPSSIRIAMAAKHAALTGSGHDLSLMGTSPSSLVSPPTDTASVSSRHTRTSMASKRTDRSLTNFDLQQNSVLSLSSDSEDDGYEASSKSSLAVPALSMSDGQVSPTSPRSAISQRSASTAPQEGNRGKMPKRTSFASQPQFLPIPEGAATANMPQISTRTSSLPPNAAAKKQADRLHQSSMLSIATTSTERTVSGGTIHAVGVHGDSPLGQTGWASSTGSFEDFPAPPMQDPRKFSTATQEQPTPPLSPTSVDFYLQSHRGSTSSKVAFDIDTRSVSSARSHGSFSKAVALPRRGSQDAAARRGSQDSNSGRFMAVTRQEEMLLAALRQKRALMRENMNTADQEESPERDGGELQRQFTGSSSGISRQSSMSTMRTAEAGGGVKGLSARPRNQIRTVGSNLEMRSGGGKTEKVVRSEQILVMMDRSSDERSTGLETAEPSPDLDGLLGFDEGFEFPMPGGPDRRESKASSLNSGQGTGTGAGESPKPPRKDAPPPPAASSGLRSSSRSRESSLRRDGDGSGVRSGSRRESDRGNNPDAIMEDPREEDDDVGVPRPDSPISPMDFPMPMSITRRKQVRLSAVGNYKPNIEAGWWDDSG